MFPSYSDFTPVEHFLPVERLFQEEKDNIFSTQFATDPNISSVISALESQCKQPLLPSDEKKHVERVTEVPDSICDFVASQLLRQAQEASYRRVSLKADSGVHSASVRSTTISGVAKKDTVKMSKETGEAKSNSASWIQMDSVSIYSYI